MLPNAFVPAPSQRVEGLLLDSCGLLAGPDAASPTNLEPLHHGYPKKPPPVMKCFVTLHENIFSQSLQAKIFPSTTQAVSGASISPWFSPDTGSCSPCRWMKSWVIRQQETASSAARGRLDWILEKNFFTE